MVQRDVLESALSVDEERHEPLEVAAPNALLSKVEATPAPRVVAQRQQQLPGKSDVGSISRAANSSGVGSFMQAFDRRYTATVVVGAQLLQSMKRRVADEFHEMLRRLGLSELELIATTKASWTMVFLVPLLLVGIIVLLIAMKEWWKDTLANKERDDWWEQKPRPAHGNFRDASSMQHIQQVTHDGQRPSAMGLLASPGKPREMTPGKSPQKSATPLLRETTPLPQQRTPQLHQMDPERATPRQSESPMYYPDQARSAHLCSELVVPDNNECSLLLPEILENRFDSNGVISIDDVNGMSVLYAAYTLAERPPHGPHELPGNGKRLILRSALEDIILASCKDGQPDTAGGPPELTIYNKSEDMFGVLRASSPGPRSSYLMTLRTGKKMTIRRDIQALSSCITDEDGWLLACTENTERGRVIRISPQQDAGLMTLAMLGTDLMVFGVVSRLNRPYSVF
jgi:hypothetical protein